MKTDRKEFYVKRRKDIASENLERKKRLEKPLPVIQLSTSGPGSTLFYKLVKEDSIRLKMRLRVNYDAAIGSVAIAIFPFDKLLDGDFSKLLKQKLKDIKPGFKERLVVIEGSSDHLTHSAIARARGTLLSLAIRNQVPVVRTSGEEETGRILIALAHLLLNQAPSMAKRPKLTTGKNELGSAKRQQQMQIAVAASKQSRTNQKELRPSAKNRIRDR